MAAKKPSAKELEKKIADLTEALKRERADAINIRRRHEEQMGSVKDFVKADIIQQLLPVIDNFERALGHVPKDLEKNDYVKGVKAVVAQFEKTLQQMGVEKIKTVGQSFDPNLHEAVSSEGAGDKEIISEELQPGYILRGEVIRHAMVRVRSS